MYLFKFLEYDYWVEEKSSNPTFLPNLFISCSYILLFNAFEAILSIRTPSMFVLSSGNPYNVFKLQNLPFYFCMLIVPYQISYISQFRLCRLGFWKDILGWGKGFHIAFLVTCLYVGHCIGILDLFFVELLAIVRVYCCLGNLSVVRLYAYKSWIFQTYLKVIFVLSFVHPDDLRYNLF